MSDRPLPPEFDKFFEPEMIGPEDPTLTLPPVRANDITQEIRGTTQKFPVLDETVEQPVVPYQPPPQRYIPPTPRMEPEHVSGERPGNGILGMAVSLIIGVVAMLALLDNVTIDIPKEDKPRAEQSESASPKKPPPTATATPDWKPPVDLPTSSPIQATPSRATLAPRASARPTATPTAALPPPAIPSVEPENSPTVSVSPPVEPPVTDEPSPTEEPTGQPTPTPEQSSTPSTAVTP